MPTSPAPTLVIGIGNPSRGDDALGPLCIEHLAALDLPGVELLTDFQLQVEYALDLAGRQRVIFIDASVSGPEPFAFAPETAAEDASYSSHALSPAAVLHACRKLSGAAPTAEVLAIRGYGFELGASLSPQATANLAAAMAFLEDALRAGPTQAGHGPLLATRPGVYPSPMGKGGEAG